MRTQEQTRIKNENEQKLLAEIKAKKTILTALPPRATFEVSRACNYICKKCVYSGLSNPPGFSAVNAPAWDWADIERVADELFPTMQYTESTLLGDPLLNRKFEAFMGLYKKHGVYFRPTTNAALLTQEKIDIMSGTVDFLKCSFDVHTRDLYHRLYLKDNFNQVVSNLKNFSVQRSKMKTYPWMRLGLVLMKSNMNVLCDYADFIFEEIGVDDMEVMGLNYANNEMIDEFYFDIPGVVNKKIYEFIEHCEKKRYRLRLPFITMGSTNKYIGRSCLDITELERPYSDEVKRGDIFGNKEQIESRYIWSNHDRVSTITADDGTEIGVCEKFLRPFLKPPEVHGGPLWVEACGSCSTYRLGDLKKQTFQEIYNNELNQKIRQFMYDKPYKLRGAWPVACQRCLCIDSIYSEENNGPGNVGRRWGVKDDLYN